MNNENVDLKLLEIFKNGQNNQKDPLLENFSKVTHLMLQGFESFDNYYNQMKKIDKENFEIPSTMRIFYNNQYAKSFAKNVLADLEKNKEKQETKRKKEKKLHFLNSGKSRLSNDQLFDLLMFLKKN